VEAVRRCDSGDSQCCPLIDALGRGEQ
jgi:hypothetical protein